MKIFIKTKAVFISILLMNTLSVFSVNTQQSENNTDAPEWFVPEGVVYIPDEARDVEQVRKALEIAFKKQQKGIYKQAKKLPGYFFLGPWSVLVYWIKIHNKYPG